jgi:hypothetical protein
MRLRHSGPGRYFAADLRRGLAALLVPALIAAGCASHEPPPTATATYRADFESCQSAVAAARTGNTAEGFFTGALLGAAYGAAAGASHGDADVGAIVGASVGAVVGFFEGLQRPRGASLSACMQSKGYRRI